MTESPDDPQLSFPEMEIDVDMSAARSHLRSLADQTLALSSDLLGLLSTTGPLDATVPTAPTTAPRALSDRHEIAPPSNG